MKDKIKKGGISVETEHIFPIIKKWLYSEKDIFLREIVSNAQDAITKLKRLSSLGQYESEEESYKITVTLDKDSSTLTVEDNGIGDMHDDRCSVLLAAAIGYFVFTAIVTDPVNCICSGIGACFKLHRIADHEC